MGIAVINPYGFIYITTNLINGKRYMGQKKFDKNWKGYLGSGNHFREAVKKYGKDNFIRNIVDIAYSMEELNEKEKQWIDNYDAVNSDDYYNKIEGGDPYKQLVKRNSIPIICVNNKMKFDSINEASLWSGHTLLTIKNTYAKVYKIGETKKLIFRPMEDKCCECGELFLKSYNKETKCSLCSKSFKCGDCGLTFEITRQRQIRCGICQKERDKINARNRKRKQREKSK